MQTLMADGACLTFPDTGLTFPMTTEPVYRPAAQRYDTMPYRRCGRSGLDLAAISLGLWPNFGGEDVFETGRAVLRRAFDRYATEGGIDLWRGVSERGE